jgi:hypothetical protein
MLDFVHFSEMVFRETDLRDRLLAEKNLDQFVRLVSSLAAERGLTLPVDEVRSRYQAAARSWLERQVR